jgi:hypothetical protein
MLSPGGGPKAWRRWPDFEEMRTVAGRTDVASARDEGAERLMSPLWWIPVVVGALALIPLVRLCRRAAAEVVALRAAVLVLADLHPAVVAVESDAARTRRALENLHLR